MALVIGLTGGIGSGKSAVADAFSALGVDVTDTDRIAHAVTAPNEPGHRGVLREFGPAFLCPDGTLDRAKLREHVFADAAARAALEALLHPLIREAAAREVERWQSPYGILVVPLLLERGGLKGIVRRILVVDCPEAVQVQRVMARSGLTAEAVRAIMATQLPRAARVAAADDLLDNAGSYASIAPQVAKLDRSYRILAAQSTTTADRL